MLKQLEIESTRYNMKLNQGKCFFVQMNMCKNNRQPDVKFANGRKMNSAEKVTYLGGTITKTAYPLEEIKNRIGIAVGTCKKLMTFWRESQASMKWKIQVFNAIILSQLTYALDTVYISKNMEKILDAVHLITINPH